jgi:hypothetical protein
MWMNRRKAFDGNCSYRRELTHFPVEFSTCISTSNLRKYAQCPSSKWRRLRFGISLQQSGNSHSLSIPEHKVHPNPSIFSKVIQFPRQEAVEQDDTSTQHLLSYLLCLYSSIVGHERLLPRTRKKFKYVSRTQITCLPLSTAMRWFAKVFSSTQFAITR